MITQSMLHAMIKCIIMSFMIIVMSKQVIIPTLNEIACCTLQFPPTCNMLSVTLSSLASLLVTIGLCMMFYFLVEPQTTEHANTTQV